jgi:hypothetical protein
MDTVRGSVVATEVEFPTRISARGVIAGLLVALAIAALMMVLGAAIGLTAFEPRGDVAKGLGIGFAAWTLFTLIVSAFFGGWVGAASARAIRTRDGVLHGVVTWAAVTVVGVALVGGAVRSTLSGIFGVAKTATQAAASSPAANQAATQAAQGAQQQGGVQQQIGNAVGNIRQNPQELAAKANQAAGGAAIGSWGMFLALVLPLGAAIGGGAWASGRERHVVGLTGDRREPHRRAAVTSPTHTGDVPTRPIPST